MPTTALSDAALLDRARDGDEAAFTELYVRHHAAARRLATTYRRLGDPDDLVNEAFEKVLAAVRRGGGPTEAFRAYLFVTLRRLGNEQAGRPTEESLDEVPEPVVVEAAAPAMERADREIITDAFESLPDRWQAVLWHTAVEGRQPRDLASVLGVSANAAAALSYRAREKLRQAYLQAHLLASPHPECEPHRSRLGAFVRGGLSRSDHAATQRHVDGCESCQALVVELTDVNRMLVRSVVPLFLLAGTGGAAALAAGGAAAGTASGTGDAGGIGLWRKVRNNATTVGGIAAAGVLIAGLAALGTTLAREDSGPTDEAADARDLGADGGGAGGPGGTGGPDSDSGDGVDAPMPSPDADPGPGPDSPADDDSGIPFDPDSPLRFTPRSPFDTDGGGTFVPSPPTPPTPPTPSPGRGPQPPSPPQPPPTSPPPPDPPDPPIPPAPPPLSFGELTWTPSAVGQGSLDVTIGERSAVAAVAPTAAGRSIGSALPEAAAVTPRAAPVEPLRLRIALTPGVRADPDGTIDERCTPTATGGSQTIDCTLQQPAAGRTVSFGFDLEIDAPDQEATFTLTRGTKVEDSDTLQLDRLEEGLALLPSTWKSHVVPAHMFPLGRLTIGAEHAGQRTIEGASIEVTLDGDAGFVPSGVGPLPKGCSAAGWTGDVTLPTGGRPPVVVGGLPTVVECQLDELTTGGSQQRELIALVRPWFRNGNGIDEEPTATVTLKLQDHGLDTETLAIDLPQQSH